MDGQREEDFDENGFDPTKEAFFSDLMGMEEEIASEAYELLEHAINLIKSKYYDDAIEVLRQAIGVYAQINREEEINAINEKISEVYLLKEKDFREGDIETEKEVVEGEEIKASVETTTLGDEKEPVDQQIIEELIVEAVQLLIKLLLNVVLRSNPIPFATVPAVTLRVTHESRMQRVALSACRSKPVANLSGASV